MSAADASRLRAVRHDGLVLDVLDDGPADGEPVVLLHGFPQDASCWDQVAPALHRAGVRTLALTQRGYAAGARPPGRAAYRMDRLVGDVVALIEQAGGAPVHLVGHDWGGAVAWAVAISRPELCRTLTVLSTPHPVALRDALRTSEQLRKSWYIGAFQLPWVPELLLAAALRRGMMRRWGVPAPAAQRYAERLGRAAALRGPVTWYRAARLARGGSATSTPVTVPTTYAWGNRDPYLGRGAAEATGQFVAGDYRFVELDAGHWLPERRAAEVAALVLERARRP